jgi:PEP-CTERM motif
MSVRSLLLAGVASVLSLGTVSAQTIIIDNFTSTVTAPAPNGSNFNISFSGVGSQTFTNTGLNASTVINPTGGTDAGIRISRAHITTGTNTINVDNTGTNDQLNVGLGTATSGHFHLYYGYNSFDATLAPNAQLPAAYNDLSRDFTGGGNNSITLSALNPDHNGGVTILLISGRGTGSEAVVSANVPYVTGNPSNQTLTFLFTAFPGINFTDIDQIIIEPTGDIPAAGDLSLDNIIVTVSAVPEPATYALMGLSGLAVGAGVWMRRRNANKILQGKLPTE